MRRSPAGCLVLSVVAAVLAGCSSGSHAIGGALAPAANATASFSGHGSVEQAYELGAVPGTQLVLVDSGSHIVGRGTADALGSLVVPGIAAGSGYTFRSIQGQKVAATKPFTVLSTGYVPPDSLYAGQQLQQGLNYVKMRDGVYINATVRLPPGKTLADGPFPTVIEYSGYQVAGPHDLVDAVLNHKSLNDPLLPETSTAIGSVLAPLLGFATVSVQMRGTGCSGGAFDLFGLPTTYDGYDVVETVAHQPWVKNHKVGMVGISFSGISQIFVAGTRPPGLAAIAPLSTTDDLYDTGYPGGIFNDGFAAGWLESRFQSAEAAPSKGSLPYANALVAQGDQQCIADQKLHLQAETLASQLAEAQYRVPALYDMRSDETWAQKVQVPVFIAGAFQDEQTGGQWPAILPYFKNDPEVFASIINGTHVDSINPAIIARWLEFLDIFVAGEVPTEPAIAQSAAGSDLYTYIANAPAETIPTVRFQNAPSVAAARADFIKNDPRVRVLFDNGGNPSNPGSLGPEWEADFAAWPPPASTLTREYLGAGGILSTTKPGAASVEFRPDPSARPAVSLPKGNAWVALPPYVWAPETGPSAVGFITAPLSHDLVTAGPAALDLWVKSSAADTDLQATVSEVRPDGQEMFVNSGDLRASVRTLDPSKSTTAHPVPTYEKRDASSLPSGRYVEVQIPITPFAYAFRAGSRIRVTIEAPGGDRPAWQFETTDTHGSVVDTVALGGSLASNLVLTVVPGQSARDGQPACPSLRGQPCRSYQPAGNGG